MKMPACSFFSFISLGYVHVCAEVIILFSLMFVFLPILVFSLPHFLITLGYLEKF